MDNNNLTNNCEPVTNTWAGGTTSNIAGRGQGLTHLGSLTTSGGGYGLAQNTLCADPETSPSLSPRPSSQISHELRIELGNLNRHERVTAMEILRAMEECEIIERREFVGISGYRGEMPCGYDTVLQVVDERDSVQRPGVENNNGKFINKGRVFNFKQ